MANSSKSQKIEVKVASNSTQKPIQSSRGPGQDAANSQRPIDGGFAQDMHSGSNVISSKTIPVPEPILEGESRHVNNWSSPESQPESTSDSSDRGKEVDPEKRGAAASDSREAQTTEGEVRTEEPPEETVQEPGTVDETHPGPGAPDEGEVSEEPEASREIVGNNQGGQTTPADKNQAEKSTVENSANNETNPPQESSGHDETTVSSGDYERESASETAREQAEFDDFYSSKLDMSSVDQPKTRSKRVNQASSLDRQYVHNSWRVWFLVVIFIVTVTAGFVTLYQLEQEEPGAGIIFDWIQ